MLNDLYPAVLIEGDNLPSGNLKELIQRTQRYFDLRIYGCQKLRPVIKSINNF